MHKNLRLVAIHLLLAFGTIFTACNRDPQVQKQKFYSKGLDFLKKGRVNEAKLQFLNAVKVDPNFAEASTTLAEIYFRETNYRRAYDLLQQAVHSKPDYMPAHRGMAQIYKLNGKLPDAQKELELVLAQAPDDVDTLMNWGTLQALQKRPKDATGAFNRVLELQPGHIGALMGLAHLSQEQNDLAGAESFFKLAHEKNPRSVPVYLELFRFYLTTGRSAEAEPLFEQALKDTGNNIQILAAQDGFFEGSNRLAEAEAVVTKMQNTQAKNPAYWGALAQFYVRTNNLPKAKAELERVLSEHKDDIEDLHRLIEVNLDMNDRKTAESLNNALLKKRPEDNYAHLMKGRLALADGNLQLAATEFNAALKFRSDWAAAHFWAAQVSIRRGQFLQAKVSLEKALSFDPNYRMARLSLAGLQNHTGAVIAGMTNAVRLLRINPHDLPALLIFTESLIYRKEYDRAEKILQQAAASMPTSADLHRQLGILNLARKNVPAARKEFQIAWELQPASNQSLENVGLGYAVQNQTSSGIDFLQQAIAGRPKDAMLHVELAKMYLWGNQQPQAISQLQMAMKIEPANPESDILLADIYIDNKKNDEAMKVLDAAIVKPGATSEVLIHAGMLYERIQHWDDARTSYENSLLLDDSNAIAKNNLAAVLVDHGGDLNIALTLAQQAKEKMVDSPEITSTLGWIYYKRQLYPTALKYLTFSASKDEKNPTYQYQLGMTRWKLGNSAEARRLLQKALALDAHFPEAEEATSALAKLNPGGSKMLPQP